MRQPSILTAAPEAAKARIRDFYDQLSPHFRDLWGPHLHDGYYARGAASKEEAQDHLVQVLAEAAGLQEGAEVLDVGCGMGATSVVLAKRWGCRTHGVTLSPVQVEIAQALAAREGVADRTRFEVRDAETLELDRAFDLLWMVGVLGHLPDQAGFVARSPRLLKPGGRFVLGDWMLGEGVGAEDRKRIVDPVLEGMLMPSIFSLAETAGWFQRAGYRLVETRDLTEATLPTWDEGVSITRAGPILKAAASIGFDALNLLAAIKGMKKAMRARAIIYGAMLAERA